MYAREYVRIDVRVKMCADAAIHGVHSLKETFHTKSMCNRTGALRGGAHDSCGFHFFLGREPSCDRCL
jgi:hypothetical protein